MNHSSDDVRRYGLVGGTSRFSGGEAHLRTRINEQLLAGHQLTILRAPLGFGREQVLDTWLAEVGSAGGLVVRVPGLSLCIADVDDVVASQPEAQAFASATLRAVENVLPLHGGSLDGTISRDVQFGALAAQMLPSPVLSSTVGLAGSETVGISGLSSLAQALADAVRTASHLPASPPADPQTHQPVSFNGTERVRLALGERGVRAMSDVQEVLSRFASPLYLSFEDIDESVVDAQDLTEFLWHVIQTIPQARIVLSSSAHTHAENVLAPLVDSLVISASDLLLSADEVVEFFADRGVVISDDEAARVAHLAMGWPALVNVFGVSTALGRFNADIAMPQAISLLGHLLRAQLDQNFLLIALIVFHLRSVTVEDVLNFVDLLGEDFAVVRGALGARPGRVPDGAHVPVHELRSAVAELIALGVLEPVSLVGVTLRYALSPVAECAVEQIVESLAEPAASVLAAQAAGILVARKDLRSALENAIDTQSWLTLVDCVAMYWWQILDSQLALSEVHARRVPAFVLNRDARLSVLVRSSLMSAPLADEGVRASSDGTGLLVRSLLGGPSIAPKRGFIAVGALSSGAAQEASSVLIQWGLARMFSGDLSSALVALENALELCPSAADVRGETMRTQVFLATLYALLGRTEDVVAYEDVIVAACECADGTAMKFARIVRSWLRSSRLEECSCSLEDFGSPSISRGTASEAELSLAAVELAMHNVCFMRRGEQVEVVARYNEFLDAIPRTVNHRLMVYLVVDAMAHLLMSTGRLSDARTVLAQIDSPHSTPFEGLARYLLLSGRYEEADEMAARGLSFSEGLPRAELALLAVRAVCHWQLGNFSQSKLFARRARELAEAYDGHLYFVLFPPAMIDALRSLDGDIESALAGLPRWAFTLFGAATSMEELSAKEIEVLRALSTTRKISMTARELYLGVNTVKTHLRNIYRKLGVHSVAEAIERGSQLGILDG